MYFPPTQIMDEVEKVMKGGASVDLILSSIYQKMVLKFGQPQPIELSERKPKPRDLVNQFFCFIPLFLIFVGKPSGVHKDKVILLRLMQFLIQFLRGIYNVQRGIQDIGIGPKLLRKL